MFCQKCGNEVNEGVGFCPKCGSKMRTEGNVAEIKGNDLGRLTMVVALLLATQALFTIVSTVIGGTVNTMYGDFFQIVPAIIMLVFVIKKPENMRKGIIIGIVFSLIECVYCFAIYKSVIGMDVIGCFVNTAYWILYIVMLILLFFKTNSKGIVHISVIIVGVVAIVIRIVVSKNVMFDHLNFLSILGFVAGTIAYVLIDAIIDNKHGLTA